MAIRFINALSSPYGRKVAVALKEKGIAHDVLYDVPWGDATCTPLYSPLEQLPILIIDDREIVYDSSYILDWLDLRYPEPALLPKSTDEIIAVRLLKLLGERVMEAVHAVSFELQRPSPSDPWLERQTRKVRRGLAEIERLIGTRCPDTKDAITIGDIAVGTTLLIMPFLVEHGFIPDLEVLRWRDRHPGLTAFADALEERPSFRDTRPALMDVDLKAVMA